MLLDDKILQRLCDNDTTLTSLNLGYNRIEVLGNWVLSSFPYTIGDEGAKAISQALHKNSVLTKLELGANEISDAGAIELGHALKNNTSLKWLSLSRNQISDEGAKALAQALFYNNSLTELYLNGNKIKALGAKWLGQALLCNTSLTKLNLEFNQITAGGAKGLGEGLLKNTTLISLDLANNRICDAGAKELSQALLQNTSLIELNIAMCQIKNKGLKALGLALLHNMTLTRLIYGGNQMSHVDETQIDNAMGRNRRYIQELQTTALMQLKLGRLLLYRAVAVENEGNQFSLLPLEIRENIVKSIDEKAIMTEEQQRLILNYAEGKIAPVADKLPFFKVTQCDRVRKQLNQEGIKATVQELAQIRV